MSRISTERDDGYTTFVVRIPKTDTRELTFRVTEQVVRQLSRHLLMNGCDHAKTLNAMHDAVQKVIDEKRDYIIERAIAYAGNRIKREIDGLGAKKVLKR